MAHFISTSGESVACYQGTRCSAKSSAELTEEHFIAKARSNPDFTEVDKPVKATRRKKLPEDRCQANLKSGKQCSRKAVTDGCCKQHSK